MRTWRRNFKMANTIEDVKDAQRQKMEDANVRITKDLFKNMSKKEQKAVVMNCSTDILFNELSRRNEIMTKQLHDIRKTLLLS